MATERKNDVEIIKRERKVIRTMFTKNANALENLFDQFEDTRESHITNTIQFSKVEELQNQLTELDKSIRRLMCDCDDTELQTEMENAFEYKSRWIMLSSKYKNLNSNTCPAENIKEKRNFRLPTLQFITFCGDLKGWLPFWGQFQKIDQDPQIDLHDKYQYLLQAMKDGSEPKALVESFTSTSYVECVKQLKARYAREDLLIQVYVRELLSMINKVNSSSLTVLYDKISAMLRALETLGVTKDKFAAFLLPMVESALPQDLLKIWERNKKENEDELNGLLQFLQKEVEGEQRILLAKKSFDCLENNKDTLSEPTAGCLLTNTNRINTKKALCIWCEKDSHSSLECYKMQKMTIDERRTHLKEKRACAICLKIGHHPKTCKAAVKCLICHHRHSVVFCTGQTQKSKDKSPSTNLSASHIEAAKATKSTADCDKNFSTNLSAGTFGTETTLLQTVSVLICNGKKQEKVRAMFDNGAQRSYIREDVAHKLNISTVGNEVLTHTLFGGVEITSKQYNIYDVNVSNLDKTFSFQLTALGQTCICKNIPKYTNDNISRLLTNHNITLSDSNTHSDDIGLLIGADFSGLLLTGDMIKLHNSLVAIRTKLGWTLQGKITSSPNIQATHVAMFCASDVSNFWSLETLGIRDPIQTKTKQQNEEEVLKTFKENVTVDKQGRYEVLLPWKVGHDELLNNHGVASQRLQCVTNKLRVNKMYEDYNIIINEWSDKGIIEIVPDPENNLESSHYLPHRPVIKEKSLTTRIRPVFDASAKDKHGKSLNLCLNKGVNMLDKIPKLLNGFRKRAIGVTADISKAFLQISVSSKDRDMLRFLWWDDEGNMKTYRHCRVVFGLTCSPFLLMATIQHHLIQVSGELKGSADILSESFYVDNCQTSLDSEEDVKKFETEAKAIMNQAKFNLTQWVIAPLANQKENDVVSILGLDWHITEDQLGCNLQDFPPLCELGKITKRNLLSITQKIYDPIGFTTAVTLVPRLILQETWRRKLNWDEELPDDLKKRFINWYKSLHHLKQCRIPRRLTATPFNESSLQLHLFTDASRDGFAACLFLRAEHNSIVSVRLISAKSRVTPPEKLSIPRLELLGTLIGSRLVAEARKDMKLQCEEFYWTDSCVALCWIKKELPWNTYIGNRVKEIREEGQFKSRDGVNRTARVRTSTGCKKDVVLLGVFMYYTIFAIILSFLTYSMVLTSVTVQIQLAIIFSILFEMYTVVLVRSEIVEMKIERQQHQLPTPVMSSLPSSYVYNVKNGQIHEVVTVKEVPKQQQVQIEVIRQDEKIKDTEIKKDKTVLKDNNETEIITDTNYLSIKKDTRDAETKNDINIKIENDSPNVDVKKDAEIKVVIESTGKDANVKDKSKDDKKSKEQKKLEEKRIKEEKKKEEKRLKEEKKLEKKKVKEEKTGKEVKTINEETTVKEENTDKQEDKAKESNKEVKEKWLQTVPENSKE